VFAKNMRDLGTPVYGKAFFRHILQTFPDNSRIIIVRLNKHPVAAAFLLGHDTTLEIPWASTIKQVNHLSMNMLLYWEVLKFAIGSNYRFFDFGRSSKDSGTYRFKQQWGAKPRQCYWHYWLRGGGELPALNPNNPKYKALITLWKIMPVWLTKWIGPGIVKNLP
jgi:serine/alanine adding enzyme